MGRGMQGAVSLLPAEGMPSSPCTALGLGQCCRIPLPARELKNLRVGSSQMGHLQVSDELQPTELG